MRLNVNDGNLSQYSIEVTGRSENDEMNRQKNLLQTLKLFFFTGLLAHFSRSISLHSRKSIIYT